METGCFFIGIICFQEIYSVHYPLNNQYIGKVGVDKIFAQWLQNEPLGQYVLAQEMAFYNKVLDDIFGLYALQIGLSDIAFLNSSRISTSILLGQDVPANLFALPEAIPCDWRSVDLVVLHKRHAPVQLVKSSSPPPLVGWM